MTLSATTMTSPGMTPKSLKDRSALTQLLDKGRDEQYNIFMKMFLAQVKHQSIDSPMSTHEMTQSVMSFFQTAEMTQTNKLLKQGNDIKMREHLSTAKSYLNKVVEYEGNILSFNGIPETIRFHVPPGIQDGKLLIMTPQKQVVKSFDLPKIPGETTVQWKGDSDTQPGIVIPHGQYIVGILAQDERKQLVDIPTYIKGKVHEIRYDEEGDEFLLMVKDTPIGLTDITSISKMPINEWGEMKQQMDTQIKNYEELNKLLKERLLNSPGEVSLDAIAQQSPIQQPPTQQEQIAQEQTTPQQQDL